MRSYSGSIQKLLDIEEFSFFLTSMIAPVVLDCESSSSAASVTWEAGMRASRGSLGKCKRRRGVSVLCGARTLT